MTAEEKLTQTRQALEEEIQFLGGPAVWGALNHGQMQCGQCSTAYVNLEESLGRLNELAQQAETGRGTDDE